MTPLPVDLADPILPTHRHFQHDQCGIVAPTSAAEVAGPPSPEIGLLEPLPAIVVMSPVAAAAGEGLTTAS